LTMINLTLDLHLHGEYAGGTSDNYPPTIEGYVQQAILQGINIIGSADCLHRKWFEDIREETKFDRESGLLYMVNHPGVSIMLTSEVNCRWGKGKQAHILLVFPTKIKLIKQAMDIVEANGNNNDGRPDVLFSPKELYDVVRTLSSDILFIPAHVLTPWFGILGSKVGYKSVAEAFKGFIPDALETGLSADTDMIEQLTDLPLVSFSDAHSCRNLGRKIRAGEIGTIEHIPQLGKYYWTGCRKCGWQMEGEN